MCFCILDLQIRTNVIALNMELFAYIGASKYFVVVVECRVFEIRARETSSGSEEARDEER